jgi:hypothetical protein
VDVRPPGTNRNPIGALMKITVSTLVAAPLADVWHAYTTPEDIKI